MPDQLLPFDPAPSPFLAHRVFGIVDGECECARRRERCKPGKHPVGRWKQEGTDDRQIIAGWMRTRPAGNFGLATGARVGYFVLDLDGMPAIRAASKLPFTRSWVAQTGRGEGLHMYFAMPDFHVGQSQVTIPGGGLVDIRGTGGYVIAPGSHHESGRQYRWAEGRSPGDVPLAPPPPWLVEALWKANNEYSVIATVDGDDEGEGWRNNALTSLGGSILRYGADQDSMLWLLHAVNRTLPQPVPDGEVEERSHLSQRYGAADVSIGEGLAVIRALLERHRPGLDLTDNEFSVLVDGLLFTARMKGRTRILTTVRNLFKQTHIPYRTVGKALERLRSEEVGFIQKLDKSEKDGTVYDLNLKAIVEAMEQTRPDRNVPSPTIKIAGALIPIKLMVPVNSQYPHGLLYVPCRSRLRMLTRLGIPRSFVTQIGYRVNMTRPELEEASGLSKGQVNKLLSRLRSLGIVEHNDGGHSLCADAQDAIERAWQSSTARTEFEAELSVVEKEQEKWANHDPFADDPYMQAFFKRGSGVHDLIEIIEEVDGQKLDQPRIVMQQGVMVDTETGEVVG